MNDPVIINDSAKEILLEQNSPDWDAWRKKGIGASEVPTIMGENPYGNALTLFRVKLGLEPPFQGNAATRRGHALEPLARRAYFEQTGESVVPHIYQSLRVAHLRASVDGINFDCDLVVEIKCPSVPKIFNMAREGIVPSYYYGQVQAQLFVTGARRAHFWVWYDGVGALVEVAPDAEYISRMIDAADRFWNAVSAGAWPWVGHNVPAVAAPIADGGAQADATTKTKSYDGDDLWKVAAAGYRFWKGQVDAAQKELEENEAVLRKMADGFDHATGAGVSVTKTNRKGQIDFKSIPAVICMSEADLEKYRKKPSTVTTITVE